MHRTSCGCRRLLGDFSAEARDALRAEGKLSDEDLAQWPLTGEIWATGVLSTIEAFAADWVDPQEDSDDAAWFEGCMRALLALTIRDEAELQADLQLRYPGQTLSREDLIDEACLALQDLRCYWVEHAPRHAPRKRAAGARPQRPLPLRQRQEVQEVSRRGQRAGMTAHPAVPRLR